MISKIELQSAGAFERWLRTASRQQRVLVLATLLVAALLSGALLYFQPGSHTFTAKPAPSAAPAELALPPGFDTYFYWGQHQPLSQQP